MTPTNEHIAEKIERYLLGRMPDEERSGFEQEIAADKSLSEEVAFQKTLMAAVRHARREELKTNLKENLKSEKNTAGIWMAIAAIFVVVISVSLLFFWQKQKSFETANSVFKFDSTPGKEQLATAPSENKETLSVEEPKKQELKKETAATRTDTAAETPALAYAPQMETAEKYVRDMPAKQEDQYDKTEAQPEENSISPQEGLSLQSDSIKTDILIKDTTIQVFSFNGPVKKQPDSLKNPAVKAKKEETRTTSDKPESQPVQNLHVEYWQSPVNFKGYKYFRNSIQLYGIRPDEKLQFVEMDGNLYLKYNKSLYKLTELNDYSNFVPVKDPSTRSQFGL